MNPITHKTSLPDRSGFGLPCAPISVPILPPSFSLSIPSIPPLPLLPRLPSSLPTHQFPPLRSSRLLFGCACTAYNSYPSCPSPLTPSALFLRVIPSFPFPFPSTPDTIPAPLLSPPSPTGNSSPTTWNVAGNAWAWAH